MREFSSSLGYASLLVATLAVTYSPVSAAAQSASPDGDAGERRPDRALHRILVHRLGPSGSELFVADSGGAGDRALLDAPGFDYNASFSPDGRWIVFTSEREGSADLYRVRTDGSGLERLTDDTAFDDQAAFSPDGSRLVFVSTRGSGTAALWILDLASGEVQSLTEGPGGDFRPSWSPDGRWIAFSSDRGTEIGRAAGQSEQLHAASIYIVRGDGSGLRRLTQKGRFAGSPKWSPDGKRVVFHRPSFGDREQGEPLFSSDPDVELAWSEIFPAFSRDGRLAVSAGDAAIEREGVGETRALALVDSGGSFRPVFHEEGSLVLSPSWSSDGERIAIGVGSFFQMRDEPARVVSVRVDGSETRELTAAPPNSGFPSYSPDGSRIVYRVWGGGRRGLRILDLEDGDVTELTRGYDNFPAWSPTGSRIAFTRFVEGDFDIYTVRPDGSELTRLTDEPGNDAHPAWSPDGEHLLFSSSRLGFRDEAPLYDGVPQPYGKLFVMEADGSDPRPITDGRWEEGTPAWDPRPGEKP